MDVYGHLMHETDNDAAQKIAALVFAGRETVASGSKLVARRPRNLRQKIALPEKSGSKMVANIPAASPDDLQVVEKLVAGVGIEPTTRGFSVRCSTN